MLRLESLFEGLGCDKRQRYVRSARGQRIQRVAKRGRLVMRGTTMDEPAEMVDVLDRVLQRRLPAGKQRDNEKDPCETGEHFTWQGLRRSGGRTRPWDRL